MNDLKIRSKEEWKKAICDNEDLKFFEKILSDLTLRSNKKELYYPAHCEICCKDVDFLVDANCRAKDTDMVNFRERLVCPSCHLNNRMRAFVSFVLKNIDVKKDIVYINEQITSTYKVLKSKLQENITGSEYLGCNYDGGYINSEGIRHEDTLNLSFSDNQFDVVLSQDVLEHIPDISRALKEINRVLRSGGKFIFSIPFNTDSKYTKKRAEIVDGKINHIYPPIYHGNPLGGGSLVFYDYGWDFLDIIKDAGFSDIYISKFYKPAYGNIGLNSIYFFLALK